MTLVNLAMAALPFYIGYIACAPTYCETRYKAVYVDNAVACNAVAIHILPQLLHDGENRIEEWWCE